MKSIHWVITIIVQILIAMVLAFYIKYEADEIISGQSAILHCILQEEQCRILLSPRGFYGHEYQILQRNQPSLKKAGKPWNRGESYGF